MVHKTSGGANKKKGMSMEEKIEKVEKWFHAHPHPYTLKELMNIIPKNTGVLYQSIEECLELLVSENRIQQDKVGIHTLFWWFAPTQWQRDHPNEIATASSRNNNNNNSNKAKRVSAAEVERARLLSLNADELQREIEETTKQHDAIRAEIDALRISVGSDAEIQKDQQELNALVQRKLQLTSEREKYANYPELPKKLKCNIDAAIEAVNRWTDNYFILEEYISKHTNLTKREIRQRAHVPADYDYVDKCQVYDLSTLKMLVKQLREPEEVEQINTNDTEPELQEQELERVKCGEEGAEEEVEHDETNHMENSIACKNIARNNDACKLPIFKTARELCVDTTDEMETSNSNQLESTTADGIDNDRISVIHNCNTPLEEEQESEAANTTSTLPIENKSQIYGDDESDDESDDAAKVKEECAQSKAKITNKRKRNSVDESSVVCNNNLSIQSTNKSTQPQRQQRRRRRN